MPPVKTDPLTPGDRLECRVGQVWFWEGYFTRVGIDLISYYGAELIQVTDLDLLAIGLGPGLESHRTIGESKSAIPASASNRSTTSRRERPHLISRNSQILGPTDPTPCFCGAQSK